MEYEIEENIPIPSRMVGQSRSGKAGYYKGEYPLEQLDVSQCLSIPIKGLDSNQLTKLRISVSSAIQNYQHRFKDTKFKMRTLKEEGFIRVWRVK